MRRIQCWLWLLLLVTALASPAIAAGDHQEPALLVQAIPTADGYAIWVQASVVGGAGTPTAGLLCDSTSEYCQPMACPTWGCNGLLTGLPAETTVEGQMSITVTLSSGQMLDSGPLLFVRAFIRAAAVSHIVSPDNMLELTLFPNSLPVDSYLLILVIPPTPQSSPQ